MRVFFYFVLFLLGGGIYAFGDDQVPEQITAEGWRQYDGRLISELRIRGAYFTRERAVRAILGLKAGDRFSADTWLYGIRKLYNTTVIYDVRTVIREAPGADTIEIDLDFIDKFPILPNVNFQGGGGSQSVGLGLIDANLGGYFTNLSFQVTEFNSDYSYDFNFFQEWLLDTDYVLGLDVSKNILPVDVQNAAGAITQSFTWSRQQNQLLLGKRFGSKFRWYLFAEQLQDALHPAAGEAPGGASVAPGGQFRFRSHLILGRSNFTNFLEEGYELSLIAAAANPLDASRRYGFLQTSFKQVWILPPNDNFALFAAAGSISPAPLPYQFHLGGYDTTRGFTTYRLLGRLYGYGTLEYRRYLTSFRASILGVDLDLIVLQGAVFTDAGAILGSSQPDGAGPLNSSLFLFSAGAGVRINFVRIPQAIVRLDWARTIRPNEGWGFSFSLGQFF